MLATSSEARLSDGGLAGDVVAVGHGCLLRWSESVWRQMDGPGGSLVQRAGAPGVGLVGAGGRVVGDGPDQRADAEEAACLVVPLECEVVSVAAQAQPPVAVGLGAGTRPVEDASAEVAAGPRSTNGHSEDVEGVPSGQPSE